jgi:hypothetical protein
MSCDRELASDAATSAKLRVVKVGHQSDTCVEVATALSTLPSCRYNGVGVFLPGRTESHIQRGLQPNDRRIERGPIVAETLCEPIVRRSSSKRRQSRVPEHGAAVADNRFVLIVVDQVAAREIGQAAV